MSAAAPPPAIDEATRREIESFVFLEARLADESRYDEWEALVTDDMHYWVPAEPSDYDPAARLSYLNDNRARLATRIRQLKTGLRHSQTPPSLMRRLISNVEIFPIDDGSAQYRVEANFVLYELARQATGDLRLWAGRTTHRLRRVGGELKMCGKKVVLVNAGEPLPNLSFLI